MMLRAVTALVLAAVPVPAVPGSAVPGSAAVPVVAVPVTAVLDEPGWAPVLAGDFAVDGVLPDGCLPFTGPHAGVAASHYRADEVTVHSGALHLTLRRRDEGGRPYTSGGLGCQDWAQRYGRYEFRAKPPAGAGLNAYVTLHADGDVSRLELLAPPGDERLYVTNAGERAAVPGSYGDGFHTYLVEWQPGRFRVTVDGREVHAGTRSSERARWVGFGLSTGDELTGLPDAATALPADFAIDWLRVWAWSPPPPPPSASPPPAGLAVPPWWLIAGAVAALIPALMLIVARLRPTRSRHRM